MLIFIMRLKHIFMGTTKFGGYSKKYGVALALPPNAPVATSLLVAWTHRSILMFMACNLFCFNRQIRKILTGKTLTTYFKP